MHGFQLWANLPRALKMTAPRYQDILAKDIPEITDDDGTHVRVRRDEITVTAGDEGVRFLLVSGRPLEEPVAWYGPIVMNSQSELQQAYAELQNGTFIKHR